MSETEFSIIDKYFKARALHRDDVVLGIGDDAAITRVPDGFQLVSAVDTLVANVHFPEATTAYDIGYKALAVNLSDMAAMGAEPAWATLALTMPQADEVWLQSFCDGFFTLAEQHNVQLIGGDTTQGPLTLTIQVMGIVPAGQALTRTGAKPGDSIFVSGQLGDAALALRLLQQSSAWDVSASEQEHLLNRLNRPVPRVSLGFALRGIASAAIDISDGLAADLEHILRASKVGATLHLEQIPVSSILQRQSSISALEAIVLGGGDDYELCFTVPPAKVPQLNQIKQQLNISVTEIGHIGEPQGLHLRHQGKEISIEKGGYRHFQPS
ncbi:MAG: thiamine-phosphate kinase [Gammaproteobacteria bacterium]|jgi:thiamine-monophosphate kinase